MTPEELINCDPKPLLIDLRLNVDHENGHIPGAQSNCVFEVAFTERMADIAPDLSAPILLYGANSRSHEINAATPKLEAIGHTQITYLEGGFEAWVDAEYPVIGNSEPLSENEVEDGEYAIDISESHIQWTGRNLLNKHTGSLGLASGKISVAGQLITGGEFVIDMNQIECDDLEGDPREGLIAHLKSDDFFDVGNHPETRLKITGSSPIDANTLGAPNLEIDGKLNIRGKDVPVRFIATCGQTPEGKLAAQGLFSIDRTLWGVIYGSGKFFHRLGMHLVNDLIDIEVKIVTE